MEPITPESGREVAIYHMGRADMALEMSGRTIAAIAEGGEDDWPPRTADGDRLRGAVDKLNRQLAAPRDPIQDAADREMLEHPPKNPNAGKVLNLTREEAHSLKAYIEVHRAEGIVPNNLGVLLDIDRIYYKLTGVSIGARGVEHIDGHEVIGKEAE